jgi:hypothetical protein
LASYGVDLGETFPRVAEYIDRILKGTMPAPSGLLVAKTKAARRCRQRAGLSELSTRYAAIFLPMSSQTPRRPIGAGGANSVPARSVDPIAERYGGRLSCGVGPTWGLGRRHFALDFTASGGFFSFRIPEFESNHPAR